MHKKDLRKAVAGVSQNKRLRAVALEVINKRASVKISGSSQLLYGIPIVGGDIIAGQEVYVDYTTGQPVVHSYTETDLSDVSISRVKTRVIIPDPDIPIYSNVVHDAVKIRGRTITTGSPVDGDTLLWNATGGSWVYGAGGEVDEAPIDGVIYGRKDGTWEEFTIPEIETGSTIAVRAYRGTTQSIPTATLTKIEFTSVQRDDGNIWDIGDPTKFTAPATGWYLINGWIDWAKDSTVTGRRQLFVYFNDVTQLTEYAHMTADIVQKGPTQSVSILVYIPAGNYIDFRVYQNRGSNLDISFAAASMILINSGANYTGGTSGSVITLTDHNDLENIGINTHTQIDEALTRLLNTSGLNTGDQDLSSYLTDSPIDAKIYGRSSGSWVETSGSQVVPLDHTEEEYFYLTGYDAETGLFTSGSVVGGSSGSGSITDHTELTNIGVNTHDQIDTALTRLEGTSGSNTGDQDLSNYLQDAPSDTKTYGRKDGEWEEVISSGSSSGVTDHTELTSIGTLTHDEIEIVLTALSSGSGAGGIEEAPIDGDPYARQDAEWVKITSGSSGVSELSDLTDVDTTGVTDGQILVYDNSTSTWLPETPSAGSSGTDILMIQVFS